MAGKTFQTLNVVPRTMLVNSGGKSYVSTQFSLATASIDIEFTTSKPLKEVKTMPNGYEPTYFKPANYLMREIADIIYKK